MRFSLLKVLILCMVLSGSQVPGAYANRTVTLTWDASPDADVIGYRVEYGSRSGVYSSAVDVGNITTTLISGLLGPQAYYFVVRAVNTAGLVSERSNEVTLPPTLSYDQWSAQIPDVAQRIGSADPDKDGLTNLGEFALGRQPDRVECAPSLNLHMSGSILSVEFSHPSDRPDVQYFLQESSDLITWRSVDDLEMETASTGTTHTVLRELVGTPAVFYRLKIERGADSTFTSPYGVLRTVITGTSSAGNVPTTMFGMGVTRPVEFTGDAESVEADTIFDREADWSDGRFEGANGSYLLEITSGPAAGTSYDIVKTSADGRTIRVAQPFAANLPGGFTYQIRKHWTLASVFGAANEVGLKPDDRVIVRHAGVYEQYYYVPDVGWRSFNDPTADVSGLVFYPEDGITVQCRSREDARLFLVGEVKRSVTSAPVSLGMTMYGNVYARPMTLDSSGLYTGNPATGVRSGTVSDADWVLLWNGVRYRIFFYKRNAGWREINDSSNNNAGKTQIPVSGTVTIFRTGGSGFNWVQPPHPSGL